MVPLEIDEGITDSPDGSLRDAATATDFDPSDSSVPRYVKYFFLNNKKTKEKSRKNPSAIDSDSLNPLSELHSKSKFEW